MKTKIIITIGDYNGIGPETIVKALADKNILNEYNIAVITPEGVLEYYSKLYGINLIGPFELLITDEVSAEIDPGKLSADAGTAAGLAVEKAIELCMKKEYDAIVTAPINKKALNLGGYNYDGHTEMLTDLSKSKYSVMFMHDKNINIAFATTHPALKDAASLITKEMLANKIQISIRSLKKDFVISKPKVAVLGLNPHAGDEGQIGDEEIKIIKPVIKFLKDKNEDVEIDGPFPADGYFGTEKYKNYDLTFAMYHDQGFVPFKMIAGFNGVNCTIGLPFVRTSPDHGTAFDIAGKNLADPASLIEAIRTAGLIHKNRKNFTKL